MNKQGINIELGAAGAVSEIDNALDDLLRVGLDIRPMDRKGDICSHCHDAKPVIKSAKNEYYCGKCAYWNEIHTEHMGEA